MSLEGGSDASIATQTNQESMNQESMIRLKPAKKRHIKMISLTRLGS